MESDSALGVQEIWEHASQRSQEQNAMVEVEPLHLRSVKPNDTLLLMTLDKNKDITRQELVKISADEHGAVFEDWALITRDEEGEVIWARQVKLGLHKNKFRHLGVVLRKDIELGFYDEQSKESNQLESVGKIKGIQHISAIPVEQVDYPNTLTIDN